MIAWGTVSSKHERQATTRPQAMWHCEMLPSGAESSSFSTVDGLADCKRSTLLALHSPDPIPRNLSLLSRSVHAIVTTPTC